MTRRAHIQGWSLLLLAGSVLASCVEGAGEPVHGAVKFGASSAASLASAEFVDNASQAAEPIAGTPGIAPPTAGFGDTTGGAAGVTAVEGGTSGGAGTSSGMAGAIAPVAAGASAAGSSGSAGTGGSGSAGMGGAGGSGETAGGTGSDMPATSAGTLKVDITTEAVGGRYAPRNVGAIWIEDSSGAFIKTLKRWAGIRARHLTTWEVASGGWGGFFGGGNTADQMDAVSGATLRTHETHSLTWDLKDLSGALVPNGTYKVVLEVADDNFAPSASTSFEFEKGPAPQAVMTAANPAASVKLDYQP